jgi:bifunctional DNase/RNase
MIVANAKERTYKNSFVKKKNIRLAKMPFKYDLILNVIISFKVSVYKLIIMNFRKYIRIKEILFLKYNLTKDLLEVVD